MAAPVSKFARGGVNRRPPSVETSRSAGFTLVEMLAALLLISISLLALAQLTLTSISVNVANETRNGAVRVASEKTEWMYAQKFSTLVSGTEIRNLTVRGVIGRPYTLTWTVTDYPPNLKRIELLVQYTLKGSEYRTSSVIYRHASN